MHYSTYSENTAAIAEVAVKLFPRKHCYVSTHGMVLLELLYTNSSHPDERFHVYPHTSRKINNLAHVKPKSIKIIIF